jgi:ribosomal protein S18 acetylase RimI-like enzyme
MIEYKTTLDNIKASNLAKGFFEGWSKKPSPETHYKILKNSYKIAIAVDTEKDKIIGFINAVSDGILSAYIPLLEVLPEYRNQGIAKNLVHNILNQLDDIYMIDIVCDKELVSFYSKFGMLKGVSMMIRNYDKQSGKKS